jgi:hypothetical protein
MAAGRSVVLGRGGRAERADAVGGPAAWRPGWGEERRGVRCVTGNFFSVLGVRPFRGRVLEASDETAAGANAVVVLSHRYWRRRFGGDPGGGGPAPAHQRAPRMTWWGSPRPPSWAPPWEPPPTSGVPITMQEQLMHPRPEDGQRSWLEGKHQWFLIGIGRLAPGVSAPGRRGERQRALCPVPDREPSTAGARRRREQVRDRAVRGRAGPRRFAGGGVPAAC